MNIQNPSNCIGDGDHSEVTEVTKQTSQNCKVSDLMDILDNDLFNPR